MARKKICWSKIWAIQHPEWQKKTTEKRGEQAHPSAA